MLFNSFAFLLFLPIVFLLYWYVFSRSIRRRNLFVVSVSYLFYGWWDWRFLSLIAFTTLCSWLSGLLIRKKRSVCDMGDTVSDHYCRGVMIINIVLSLAILAYFKYANFFIDLNSATLLQILIFKYLSNKKLIRILPCQIFHLS